ncbi:MAG: AAA family ATPase [Kofleriaceae bacterium]
MTEANRRPRKHGLEHFLKVVRELPDLAPRVLFGQLEDHGYRGQAAARRALCLMAYRHVRRVKRIYLDGVDRAELPRKANYLLAGPTGSGKTFLVETLFGKLLRVPTTMVDVTTFSETGYVGQDPISILTRLVHAADHNPLVASIGVVCLDEFDKIASGQNNAVFAGAGTTKDVTGMGVQRELLKMLEAGEVMVPTELGHASHGDHVALSTADLGFVACGAFSGFHAVARRRTNRGGLGFGGTPAAAVDAGAIAVDFSADEVDAVANFGAYGFLPELIARFTRIVPLQALDAATLKDILRTDVITRMTAEFKAEGLTLAVDEAVLDHVVADALRLETGARGLASTLTRRLEDVAFDSFGDDGGGATVQVRLRGGDLEVSVS